MGLIPLFIFLYGIFRVKKTPLVKVFFINIGVFFLLMMGKNSPFYFIFYIFPLNMFRAPSRFIVGYIFFMSLFVGYVFTQITSRYLLKRKYIYAILIFLSFFDICFYFYNYHPIYSYDNWIQKGPIAKYLTNKTPNNYYIVGISDEWYARFKRNGWKNLEDYRFLNYALDPKLNLIYGIPTVQSFFYSFFLNRKDYVIFNDIPLYIELKKNTVSISENASNLLRILGTRYIISPYIIIGGKDLSGRTIHLAYEVSGGAKGDMHLYVYEISQGLPLFYFPQNLRMYTSYNNLKTILLSKNVPETAFVEESSLNGKTESQFISSYNLGDIKYDQLKGNERLLKIKTTSKQETFMVFNQSYSSNWHVLIDSKNVQPLITNWKFMGVTIPRGTHIVLFFYQDYILESALFISIMSYTSLLLVTVYLIFSVRRRKD